MGVGNREVFRQGLKWEVENGASINFLKESLVSTSRLRLWPNVLHLLVVTEDISVQNFISLARQWDQVQLNETVRHGNGSDNLYISSAHGQVDDRLRFLGDRLGCIFDQQGL